MAKTKTKKKPNAADLTLRNIRAEKKRFAELVARVAQLEARNLKFGPRLQRLEEATRELKDDAMHASEQVQALLKREDDRGVTLAGREV